MQHEGYVIIDRNQFRGCEQMSEINSIKIETNMTLTEKSCQ